MLTPHYAALNKAKLEVEAMMRVADACFAMGMHHVGMKYGLRAVHKQRVVSRIRKVILIREARA